ncbi:MAG: acyltransferase [Rubrivivax sp.]|nr:acyltransferase [Rubrivivax sp.]
MTSAESYREDLDTLRALAVGLVLVFHFSLIPGMSGGFLGVDVFFVISGYIITRKNLPAALDGRFRLSSFWMARVRRLAPALLITLVLTLLVGCLYYLPAQLESLAKQALATQAYVANIFYWRTVNYFGLQAKLVPLLHTWSLAVEEQFYLLYPLLLLAAARIRVLRLTLAVIAITLLSFVLCLWMLESRPEATFYLAPTRIWELGIGCLLAIAEWHRRSIAAPASTPANLGFVLCLIVVVASAVFYNEGVRTPGWYSLIPVLGTAAMIWFGASISGWVRQAWNVRALRYIGHISYPLYLTHWPINVFAKDMLHEAYTWEWRLACLVLSVLSAAAIHEWAEKPIAAMRGLTLRRVLIPYGLATLALCGVCVAILTTQGLPQRFSPQVLALVEGEKDRPPDLAHCIPDSRQRSQAWEHAGCRLGELTQEPTTVVLGDSHAWTAAPALSAALKSANQSARITFLHACPPLMGVHLQDGGRDQCYQHNTATFDWVIQQPRLQRVILVSTWIQGRASLTDNPLVAPSADTSPALFASSLAKTVEALKKAGKQVYLIGPVPGARYSVPQTLARNERAQRPLTEGLSFSAQEHRTRHAYFAAALPGVAGLVEGYFDPATVLCDAELCRVTADGRALYFDSDHLGTVGSRLLVPGMTQLLSGALKP